VRLSISLGFQKKVSASKDQPTKLFSLWCGKFPLFPNLFQLLPTNQLNRIIEVCSLVIWKIHDCIIS